MRRRYLKPHKEEEWVRASDDDDDHELEEVISDSQYSKAKQSNINTSVPCHRRVPVKLKRERLTNPL